MTPRHRILFTYHYYFYLIRFRDVILTIVIFIQNADNGSKLVVINSPRFNYATCARVAEKRTRQRKK